MKTILPTRLIAITLLALSTLSARAVEEPLLLQNFDLPPHGSWDSIEQPDIGNYDEDSDLEARVTTAGRKPIFKIKIKRKSSLIDQILSGERPVLSFTTKLPDGFKPVNPPRVVIILQSDPRGKGPNVQVYDQILIKTTESEVGSQTKRVSVDLATAQTAGGVTARSLLQNYANGDGTFFQIVIMQVVPAAEVASVIYDDFALMPPSR